jgi:hypothetical protein
MSMLLSKGISVLIAPDGVSTTITLRISDACLFMGIPDISPVDSVDATGILQLAPNPAGIATLSLNSRGTVVTATFPTPPQIPPGYGPGYNAGFVFSAYRNV